MAICVSIGYIVGWFVQISTTEHTYKQLPKRAWIASFVQSFCHWNLKHESCDHVHLWNEYIYVPHTIYLNFSLFTNRSSLFCQFRNGFHFWNWNEWNCWHIILNIVCQSHTVPSNWSSFDTHFLIFLVPHCMELELTLWDLKFKYWNLNFSLFELHFKFISQHKTVFQK